MATKAPADMTVGEALIAYGFILEHGLWSKPGNETQHWQVVPGGFRRLERATTGIVIGAPAWGRETGEADIIEVPYRQSAKYDAVSGLHPNTHQEAFEWVWPAEAVREIYAYAYTGDSGYGRPWKRNDEGALVQDRAPRE